MTMMKAAPSESSIVRLNGVPLSAVTAVSEYERRSEKTITGFGDSQPSATVAFNTGYYIELERVCPVCDGAQLKLSEPFTLQTGAWLYSGCRCTELGSVKKPDGTEIQRIKITAIGRREAQNG